jgi:hypothetical protein
MEPDKNNNMYETPKKKGEENESTSHDPYDNTNKHFKEFLHTSSDK